MDNTKKSPTPPALAFGPKTATSRPARVRADSGEPPRREALSLDEMLARFDPAKHGGEAMAFLPVGAERL